MDAGVSVTVGVLVGVGVGVVVGVGVFVGTDVLVAAGVFVAVLVAMGVFVGVLTSALFFARKVSRFLQIESYLSEDKENRTYKVFGQVFFASAEIFSKLFDFKEVVQNVIIDVSSAHFWDLSAVGALDKVVMKFRREGTAVDLIGLNEASATIVDRLAVYDKPNALELMLKH